MTKNKKSLQETHPELAAEWHPTKNGTLTPDNVSSGSHHKVWWYLPYNDPITGKCFDFEWQAVIASRSAGVGCPFLSTPPKAIYKGFNDLATTHPELAAQWHPTKNGTLTPQDIAAGSGKKIWWYLPYDDPVTSKHFDFEWEAVILNRKQSQGCPFLSGKAAWKGFNDLATTHPELAKQWHPTKNGKLTPNDITAGSNKKVWWILPYREPQTNKFFLLEWTEIIVDRVHRNNNLFLPNKIVIKGFNDLTTTHPHLVAEWHPTKNGNLTPCDVIAGSDKKVWWRFPYDDPITGKHFDFEWKASIYSRAEGLKCPFLSNQAIWKGFNDLATTHPNLAKEWHPTKNGTLTPYDLTAGSDKNIWWLLPYDDPVTGKHFNFEWQAIVLNRKKGDNCPYLSGQSTWRGFNDLATTHPELAAQWHPTKNKNIFPYEISAGCNKKVWWKCSVCGYEWNAMIVNRSKGCGCPLCSSSQGEKIIFNLLQSQLINFVKEHSFPDCKYKNILRFDFAIFDKNNKLIFIIEYDGKQHNTENKNYFHKYISYEECQKRDEIKNQYCKDNNIPLLRISYEDSDKIEDIVVSELKKYNLI